MALGVYPEVGLAKAREDRDKARKLLAAGNDPMADRNSLLSERGWSVAALERQLDHSERSKVVAAYTRSEHLEERRRMMGDWGSLVDALEADDNVVPLARAA